MPKLRVQRKGYKRADGTRVKATSFLTKDTGKRGRTPKSERWFVAGEELGWRKGMQMEKRRRVALKNRGGDYLATGRALQALANVTADKRTKELASKDAAYFFKEHKKRS